jgi:hypothetical protein
VVKRFVSCRFDSLRVWPDHDREAKIRKLKIFAEKYALPSYKWISGRRYVKNMQNWTISNFPGGIGFSLYDYADDKALKVFLNLHREDGVCEHFLIDTYCCGEWGDGRQKWQTHQLPLFPYEGLHGRITHITFSYIIHMDGRSIPSRLNYKFAALEDFHRGWTEQNDFSEYDPEKDNTFRTYELEEKMIKPALDRINFEYAELPIRAFFTRGNTDNPSHPMHEIHRQIDNVIKRQDEDPQGRHYIQVAVFDFDNHHFAQHLIHARERGVDVECMADWAAVSSMNSSENIARMRCAGIPVIGVVRNTPCDPSGGITSMHTKFIIFDGEVVHCSSYNLHFHLWGGNWEHALFYYSRDFAALYTNIYHAIRGGVVQPADIDPLNRFNLYYSFGCNYSGSRKYRSQDAILTEINNAESSIIICMFDLGYLTGIPSGAYDETDLISALINARNRGVTVKIILNGMITHTGPLPEPWDLDRRRPLKEPVRRLRDAWMEIVYIYYRESVYSPLHHKFAVFDASTVIAGSYNWYEASIHSDEVFSVIRDKKMAAEFIHEAVLLCKSFRMSSS